MHVAGHLGEISCTEAANAGIHSIEHGLTSCAKDLGIAPDAIETFRYDPSAPAARRLISLLVAKGVVMVATPTATEPYEATAEELSMLSPDQRARYEESLKVRPPWMPSSEAQANWDVAHRAFERHFAAAGGRLLVGGDASDMGIVPGFANHRALIALVRSGFPPLQAIKFATADAAAFLGAEKSIGTVAVGKTADLLVVKGQPDRNIEDIRNVIYVFKEGAAYDPAKLKAAARGMLGLH